MLLTAGLAFALAACGDDNSSDDVASSATEASASVADESAEPTDDAADASIERVVCLTGACIDGLYLLGMQPVAANDFLHFSDVYFGPDADIGPVSGSFFEPSIEDIVAAEPDLVIGIAGVHDALETSLDPIPLMIVDPIGVEGAIDTLRDIGERVGRPAEAEEAISSFEDRWATVTTSVESPRSSVILFTFDGVTVGAELLAAPAASLLDGISDYAYQVEDVQGEHSATLSLEELLV
ncbi:MAG: ABC transporter substrate-binding protein, partial [Actinomycetota bacterium]